ncbi:MAG: isocitrate lyase/phosphoenolpyruvate mutase family protein, partial [Parasphingorhabdus sp.]
MDKISAFKSLHIPGNPLILVNIWDAGSAKAVEAAGAKALATGSYGVAGAQGIDDGEHFPLDAALANLEKINVVTDLPVSIDMEAGYGDNPEEVEASVKQAKAAGACGINMEDRLPGETKLLSISDYCPRLEAAAKSGLHINARCDTFLGQSAENDGERLISEVLERSDAYAGSGASSLFVPFLSDAGCISEICQKSSLPINILRSPDGPTHSELASMGVARISHGHQSWAGAMTWLEGQASK